MIHQSKLNKLLRLVKYNPYRTASEAFLIGIGNRNASRTLVVSDDIEQISLIEDEPRQAAGVTVIAINQT